MAEKKSKFEAIFSIGASLSRSFNSSIGGAISQTNKLGATIRQAEQGKAGIKRFQTLKTGLDDTKKSLEAARTRAAALKKQFDQTDRPTKKLKNQMAAAHKEVHTLSTRLKDQRKKLGEAKAGLDQAGISTRRLSDANARLSDKLNRARVSQDKLNRAMSAQRAAGSAMRSRAGKAAKAGAVTGAAVGAMALPVANSLDFSEGMAKVRAVSGANGEDFQALRGQALELGESTQHSASTAAKGMEYLAMAGFKTGQILGAMPGILDLTTASGEELGTTADIGANILSAFGYEAGKMGKVGDILTKTFTSSKTTLGGLGETLKYVGPITKNARVSLAETAAMAGKLGDEGIDASMAGTSLRSIISNLAGPTSMARDALDELGIETKDQAGNLRNVIDIFEEFSETTADMGSGDRVAMFKKIFGAEAASAASILIKQAGTGALRDYSKQLEDSAGVASKVARTMEDNLKGSFIEIGSAIEGASISFTDVFAPALKAGAKAVAGTIRDIAGWIREHQTLTKVIAGGTIAIGGLVTGALTLGAAVSGISFAIGGLATLGPVLAGLKTGFLAINAVVLANPIAAVAAGLAAGAYLIYKNWDSIRQLFIDIGEKIGGIMQKIPLIGRLFKDDDKAGGSRPFVRAADRMPQGRGAANIRQENNMPVTVNVGADANRQEVTRAVQDGITGAMGGPFAAINQERRLAYE